MEFQRFVLKANVRRSDIEIYALHIKTKVVLKKFSILSYHIRIHQNCHWIWNHLLT